MARKSVTGTARAEHWELDRGPDELGIEVKVEAVFDLEALLFADISVFSRFECETSFDFFEHFEVPFTALELAWTIQIPKPVVEIEIRA